MTLPQPPIEEEDAVRRVLRHHQVPLTRELVRDLGTMLSWVREDERSKAHWASDRRSAPMLITLMSSMGIWGREYIDAVPDTPAVAGD